jgi:hypothetical protein
MAFPIIPKLRSGAPGNPASLQLGELAVNCADGELYLGGDGGVMLLNGPVVAGTTVTEHTADGTTLAFLFGGYNGTADGGYIVSVGGIDQPPSKYSISSTAGGTITFVEAPVAGELISIRAIVAGSGGGGGSGTVTSITAGTGLDGGTITDSGTISLASITTAQSNVGSSTAIPVLSINDQGQVTALSTTAFVALTTAQIAGLSTTAPAALSTTAIAGLSQFAARADHAHLLPSAAAVGALGATAAAGGDLTGNYPNPTLGAITTAQSNVGSSSVVPVLSVDAKGRVTSLTTAAIQAGSSAGITSLTGDVTASGPGAATATLASITTAQSNVGSSTQIPVLSIDAKGRVTSLTTQKIAPAYTANVLIVAGGGGGTGGGGGAGGMIENVMPLVFGSTYSIVVGAGGAGTVYPTPGTVGANGTYSAFATVTAIGGGGAGRWGAATAGNLVGQNGGSGGGAGANTSIGASSNGGSGTQGQGKDGGATPGISASPAGGGGGAGAVGSPGTTNLGGNGGVGLQSSITGSATYYAGGGGGSSGSSQGTGGLGGGGNGAATTGFAGAANTGGGGGGATGSPATGGNGGSGVVILSIPTSQYTGITTGSPTVTTSGSNTILTYTSSGTYAA